MILNPVPWVARTVAQFAAMSDDEAKAVIGGLNTQVATVYSHHWNTQTRSWHTEIELLRSACQDLASSGFGDAKVILEYEIPRRRRRPDAIVLLPNGLVIIEFKVGNDTFDASSRWQLAEYILDLRDFHSESHGLPMVGLLVATKAIALDVDPALVHGVRIEHANAEDFSARLATAIRGLPDRSVPLNADQWLRGRYDPTPNIIEAASRIYAEHDISEISHSYAENLTTTTRALVAAVLEARRKGERVICFVTGVPGAGKTLTGLEALHDPELNVDSSTLGVFLSGNGPLVEVLQAALASSKKLARKENRRLVTTRIDNVHKFVPEYAENRDRAPAEHLVVFDEAQRAWSRDHMEKKRRGSISEADELLEIMERLPDWAAVIALVGGGQEINQGEAGLSAWGEALALAHRKDWTIVASPEVMSGGTSVSGHRLFEGTPPRAMRVIEKDSLHLRVSVRAPRARIMAEWVEAVLEGRWEEAAGLSQTIAEYPLAMTRDLRVARAWLRAHVQGEERIGLIASAGARRLRAYGVQLSTRVGQNAGIAHWFRAPGDDVRSSNYLEVAATEFECQGLELDYACLCWGDDLTRRGDGWEFREFSGSRWNAIRRESDRAFMTNTYRVLMTRARRGLIIWIPPGSVEDSTRSIGRMDDTAAYLAACGVTEVRAEVKEGAPAMRERVRFE